MNETELLASVDKGRHLSNLLKHPGWRIYQEFIDGQRKGTHSYMEKEVQSGIGVLGLAWLFNTFIKYITFLFENRAYNKLDAFIKLTIEKGERSRKRLERVEATKERGNA